MSYAVLSKLQKIKWPYLGSWATNQKTKDTFFSSTFKVRESKVSLVFEFMAQGPRYWHFPTFMISCTLLPELQKIKWPYLGPWAINEKTKDTLLSQTFKVEEKKVSLVFLFVAQEPRYGPFIF